MTAPDTTLVRVLRGSVGPVTPEDGYLVRLAADVAADLVQAGEAVRVADREGAVSISTPTEAETALAPSSDVGRKRRISE